MLKFWFKTLTIPFHLQKEFNASNIGLDQELCSHPNFSLPNTDGHTGHKIPVLLFLADSLINSMTNQPKISLIVYVKYEHFFFLT